MAGSPQQQSPHHQWEREQHPRKLTKIIPIQFIAHRRRRPKNRSATAAVTVVAEAKLTEKRHRWWMEAAPQQPSPPPRGRKIDLPKRTLKAMAAAATGGGGDDDDLCPPAMFCAKFDKLCFCFEKKAAAARRGGGEGIEVAHSFSHWMEIPAARRTVRRLGVNWWHPDEPH